MLSFHYTTLDNHTKRAINDLKLNIDGKDYSFHSFRKCAATNLYSLTGDILAVKEYLNHSNLDTTQKYVKPKSYGVTGIYSMGSDIDKELYKKVDNDVLIEAIESIDKSLIHLLNVKLSEKIKHV